MNGKNSDSGSKRNLKEQTCPQCEKKHLSKTKYCSSDCKRIYTNMLRRISNSKLPKTVKICPNCNGEYTANEKLVAYCSFECREEYQSQQMKEYCKTYRLNKGEKKYADGVLGYDYIECPVCKQKIAEISQGHAIMHGFSSPTELVKHYGLESPKCKSLRDAFSGENNPRIPTWWNFKSLELEIGKNSGTS